MKHEQPLSPHDESFNTPPASLGLLSPLSSMDLSAEPLSPSTMAFFRVARAHAAALQAGQPHASVSSALN